MFDISLILFTKTGLQIQQFMYDDDEIHDAKNLSVFSFAEQMQNKLSS